MIDISSPLRVHAFLPSLMPSATLLVLKPFFELERRGVVVFDFTVGSEKRKPETVAAADLIIVLRGTTLADLNVLRLAEKLGKPLIYEIDDNFHAIPLNLPIGRLHRDSLAIGVLDRFLKRSTLVRVYSPAMKAAVEAAGGNGVFENLYFDPPITTAIPADFPDNAPITLAFASARQGSEAEEKPMMDAIEKILIQRSDGSVRVVFWKKPPAHLAKLAHVEVRTPVASYTSYIKHLTELQPVIGLAPLGDDLFYRSKTNNKYREYGGLGIPAIYSDVDLYNSVVNSGKNGLLASPTVESWTEAITRLLDNQDLRDRISSNAHEDVIRNFSFAAYIERWQELLESLKSDLQDSSKLTIEKGVPVVSVFGTPLWNAPLSSLAGNLISELGGYPKQIGQDDRNPLSLSRLRIATAADKPVRPPKDAVEFVDVTLCSKAKAGHWARITNGAFSLATKAAARGRRVESVQSPKTDAGRYDSAGAAARLLHYCEILLDKAGRRELSSSERFMTRVNTLRYHFGQLAFNLRRTADNAMYKAGGKKTLVPAALVRDYWSRTTYAREQKRELKRLRKDRHV